jgi:hypothetical protein
MVSLELNIEYSIATPLEIIVTCRSRCEDYRGTSLIRKRTPPKTTIGP